MATNSVLINYNDYPFSMSNLMPDNGLAYLAGSLMAKGHTTRILDYATVPVVAKLFPYEHHGAIQASVGRITKAVLEGQDPDPTDIQEFTGVMREVDTAWEERLLGIAGELADSIDAGNLDFIGLKLWTGKGFSGSVLIAKELRKRFPGVPIIAGGPHVHWFHENIHDVTDVFDIIVDGEGEDAIWMLAEHFEGKRSLDNIPNLIYRKDGRVVKNPVVRIADINELPDPVYSEDVYPAMAGDQKVKIILLDESRGCPNMCNFCIHPKISGRKWRLADPERFVARIARLQHTYGFNAFRLAGSNPPQHITHEIAEQILAQDMHVTFTTNFHARGLQRGTLELLAKAGCQGGFFGIESGSDLILDTAMNKKTSVQQMRDALTMCEDVGIPAVGSVIIPSPFGTDETTKQTLDLLLETKPASVLVCFPGLIPGSTWYEQPERFGFHVDKTPDFFKQAMTYDIDLFSPPILWKPLEGYMLDGKNLRVLATEAFEFCQLLERQGLTTQITDEMFMMAKAAEMTPQQLKDACLQAMLTGDKDGLHSLVSCINQQLTS